MFTFRFFGSFSAQRKAFEEAREFKAPTFPASFHSQLERIAEPDRAPEIDLLKANFWMACLGSCRDSVRQSAIFGALSALLLAISLTASRFILDYSENLALALGLCVLFFACEIASNICIYKTGVLRLQALSTVNSYLLGDINKKLLSIDREYAHDFSKGNLKTLVASDLSSIENFLGSIFWMGIPGLTMIVVLSPLLLSLGGMVAAVGLAISFLQLPISMIFSRLIARSQHIVQARQDRMTTLIGEWIRNIRLVRYLGWQPRISSELSQLFRRYSIAYALRHLWICFAYGIGHAWWLLPLLGMLYYAQAMDLSLSVGEYFTMLWALNHISHQVSMIPVSINMYGQASAGAERIRQLLAAPDMRRHFKPESAAAAPQSAALEIVLEQVQAAYKTTTILNNFSVKFDLRKRTAIVGEVGGGKSTLLKLLVGELAPHAGRILLKYADGAERDFWEPRAYAQLRRDIAYVPQEPFLSNASVLANIRLDGDPDDQALQKAIDAAALRQDIESFPGGLLQEVGEIGINLSGGQKQRINIARAFFSGRPLFVLDDPLSAVDKHTEQQIVNALLATNGGIILVSHRLHELSSFDRVLVIEQGAIVEDAAPATLMENPSSRFMHYLRAFERLEAEAAPHV